MPKLKLDLEAIAVESFDADAAGPARDALSGHPCSAIDACPSRLCATSLC
ncbi:MAG TPA: hypothetical protein VF092_16660 [Longimicrobium sp.]